MHDHAGCCIIFRWHGSGSSARRGSRARSCCGSPRGHPDLEVVARHRRHPGRHAGRRRCTRAWPPPTRTSCSRPYDAAACAGLDLVFLGLPARRQPGDRARAASARSATSSTSPPTSGSTTPACTRSGTARPTPPPSCSPTSPTGSRSCSGTTSWAPPTWPRRAATRRRRRWPLAPLVRAGVVEPTGIVVDAASGVSGRGPAPEAAHHLLRGRRGLHRLRPARPPAHARDRAGHRRARCSSRPHLAPMNRGILATCYARPTGATSTDALLDLFRATYADEPFVVVGEASPSTKATLGSNTRAPHRPLRRAHRLGRGALRHRQPHQGRVRPGRPVRQPPPRPPRDHRPPDRGGVPVSVTAPQGSSANGVACGIKASGDPDLSLVATADGAAVAAAGVFTQNKMTAAPVVTTHAHLTATGGRAAAVVLNSGCANAATGERGVADAEEMCALVATALGCAPEEVLVCSTGPHRLPRCRWTPSASGVAGLVAGRRPTPTAGSARPRPSAPPTPSARRPSCGARASSSGAWPRARRCSPPTWPRCWRCSPPTPTSSPARLQQSLRAGVADSFNAMSVDGCTSTNDTVLLLASGVGRSARRPRRVRRRGGRGVPRPRHADGRRRRGPHQGGAGARRPAPRPTTRPAPAPGRWPRASS